MSARYSVLVLVILSCFGCVAQTPKPKAISEQHVSGHVTGGLVEPPASDRYKTAAGAHYEQPVASPDNPMPAYPPELLSKRLSPISVEVRVVVDTMGRVTSVTPEAPPNQDQLPFVQSVRSALKSWEFTQLVEVIPADKYTTLVDAKGSEAIYPGKAEALPFHQDYRFTFSQTNGKANVSVNSAVNSER